MKRDVGEPQIGESDAREKTDERDRRTRDPDLCVVTCALTGVLANRKQCPAIPYTPVEIAEEARRAYDAGAAVVHIHARNDDGIAHLQPGDVRAGSRRRCRSAARSSSTSRPAPSSTT